MLIATYHSCFATYISSTGVFYLAARAIMNLLKTHVTIILRCVTIKIIKPFSEVLLPIGNSPIINTSTFTSV
jgi:hypothetical protein